MPAEPLIPDALPLPDVQASPALPVEVEDGIVLSHPVAGQQPGLGSDPAEDRALALPQVLGRGHQREALRPRGAGPPGSGRLWAGRESGMEVPRLLRRALDERDPPAPVVEEQ